jgi:amino acid transporter
MSEGVVPPSAAIAPGAAEDEILAHHTQLEPGALGLTGAVMQGVALIGPAVAALFFAPFVFSLAGINAPLAYPIGFVITAALGWVLVQYARKLPSAGGYFTYNSRALHPWAGWLSTWSFTFYVPLVGGPISAYFGFILQGVLHDRYGWTFHWWIAPIVMLPIISLLAHRGIKISQEVLVILGAAEFLIVLALGISGLVDPGPGGFNFASFNPSHIGHGGITWSGFGLAAIFAVQAYTGWDGAAPLAEETRDPKRNVPRAVMWSIVILGAFLVVVNWGEAVGWGTDNISKLPSSSTLPALVLGERLWGGGWVILLVAFFSSVMAVALACNNVSTRMWYKQGQIGAFPRVLGRVHPTYRTPTVAIGFQFALNLFTGLILGFIWGPDLIFFFLTGLTLVLGVIFVYTLANVGVFFFYRREYPSEFSWLSHLLVPVAATAALAYLLVKSFQPFPPAPYKWAPLIVGLWLILGVVILYVNRVRGREEWLLKAGEAIAEIEEEADREALPVPAV